MNQEENKFKDLLDTRRGDIAELKKSCADTVGIDVQMVHRMYRGDRDIVLSAEQFIKLLTWANKNKVPNAPDVSMTDLVPESVVVTFA